MKLTVESKPMHQRRLVMSLRILGECVRPACGQGAAAAPLPTGWPRASWRAPDSGAHIPWRGLEVGFFKKQKRGKEERLILVVRSRAAFGKNCGQ